MKYPREKRYRRRRGRRRRPPLFSLVLLLAACAVLAFFFWVLPGDSSVGGRIAKPALELQPPAPPDVDTDRLYSSCALLVRLSDGAVLMEKDSEKRTWPASLTKMMTVLTFLENYESQNEESTDLFSHLEKDTYTLPQEIFPILAAKHASMAGFQPGETVTLLDLLYASHLPSGADGSMGLAYDMAGSEQGFVDLMNEKAAELGMEHTHFANVTGLHDPDHYTTAEDLAILMKHALKNQAFRTIFTAKKHMISPTNYHPDGFPVYSTLSYKLKDFQINRAEILGGKTGYTGEAGLCLASLAKKGSQEYILITMGAPGNTHTEQYNIDDAKTVYGAL